MTPLKSLKTCIDSVLNLHFYDEQSSLPILPVSELHVQSLTEESEDAEATSNWEEDRDMASTAHTGPECPEHTAHAVNCSRRWTNTSYTTYFFTFVIIHLQTNIKDLSVITDKAGSFLFCSSFWVFIMLIL